MTQIISYTASNGARVDFSVGQQGLHWRDVAGVYMFCARTDSGVPVPVYIGQAENFSTSIPGHPQWEAAIEMGAVAVLVKTVSRERERAHLQSLLLADFDPPLNPGAAQTKPAVYRFESQPQRSPKENGLSY
ncbi:MAG TPA: hypothetical protein VLJ57_06135 [Burkholderiaceae bacterium]|nr:hypothetical protein [Burkholderiaceae bacterium]